METQKTAGHWDLLLRKFKNKFKELQFSHLRWFVAIIATIQQSILYRKVVLIYLDREGDWINFRDGKYIVSPVLNVTAVDRVRKNVIDLWCFKSNLNDGDVVFDIGAGVGEDVIAFSELVGKSGRVIAIEAHPVVYRCLAKTVKLNCLGNVGTYNVAAAQSKEILYLTNDVNTLGNTTLDGRGTIPVTADSLDDLFRGQYPNGIKLVKMNIEGGERDALAGMEGLLSLTSSVVISCHDFIADSHGGGCQFRTFNDVGNFLRSHQFDLFVRDSDHREEVRYYWYGLKGLSSATHSHDS